MEYETMTKREDRRSAKETMCSRGAVPAVEMLEAMKTKGAAALFPSKAMATSRQEKVGGQE